MEEKELINSVPQQETVDDSVDYIEAIKEMKQNTVDKNTYLKLKEENRKLLQSLVNGEQQEIQKEEPVDIDQLRNDIFNKESTNLEYITNVLKLRDELIKRGERDPFLPYGKNILPTDEDIATANRVAKALQECVDYADGNSDIFTSELQRITIDSAPIKRR